MLKSSVYLKSIFKCKLFFKMGLFIHCVGDIFLKLRKKIIIIRNNVLSQNIERNDKTCQKFGVNKVNIFYNCWVQRLIHKSILYLCVCAYLYWTNKSSLDNEVLSWYFDIKKIRLTFEWNETPWSRKFSKNWIFSKS
jgi:hypothetical protein